MRRCILTVSNSTMSVAPDHVEFHPLSTIFPLLEGFQFTELVEDIRTNGLRTPISLYESKILDGRNRYRACKAAQIPLRFSTVTPADALAFVVSANLYRRHLDSSQRAVVARRVATLRAPHGTHSEIWREYKKAASDLKVGVSTVYLAERLERCGEKDVQEAVERGQISLHALADVLCKSPEEQRAALPGLIGNKKAVGRHVSVPWDHKTKKSSSYHRQIMFVALHGRLGDLTLGDIRRAIPMAVADLAILQMINAHYANADLSKQVRDVFSEKTLASFIRKVNANA